MKARFAILAFLSALFSISSVAGPLEDALRKEDSAADFSGLIGGVDSKLYEMAKRGSTDDAPIEALSARAVAYAKRGANPVSAYMTGTQKRCPSLIAAAVSFGFSDVVRVFLDRQPNATVALGEDAPGYCRKDDSPLSIINNTSQATDLLSVALNADLNDHCYRYCAKKKAKLEDIAVMLLDRQVPVTDREAMLVRAVQRGFERSAKRIVESKVDVNRAMKLAGTDEPLLTKIAALTGEAGHQALLAYYAEKKARLEAEEKTRRLAEAEREKRRQEQAHAEAVLKNKPKSIGDRVCRSGIHKLIWETTITVKGFVENVNGNKIQIRISDDGGGNWEFDGITMRKDSIIWDNFDNWMHCR
jgi:hypothetical protein